MPELVSCAPNWRRAQPPARRSSRSRNGPRPPSTRPVVQAEIECRSSARQWLTLSETAVVSVVHDRSVDPVGRVRRNGVSRDQRPPGGPRHDRGSGCRSGCARTRRPSWREPGRSRSERSTAPSWSEPTAKTARIGDSRSGQQAFELGLAGNTRDDVRGRLHLLEIGLNSNQARLRRRVGSGMAALAPRARRADPLGSHHHEPARLAFASPVKALGLTCRSRAVMTCSGVE